MDLFQEACKPTWRIEGHACPHGHAFNVPFSGFTVHNHVSYLDVVAFILSSLPVLLFMHVHVRALVKRGIADLFGVFLFWVLILATFVAKSIVVQPRPAKSCLTSCGMPSGHSAMSIGFVCWFAMVEQLSGFPAVLLLLVPWSRWHLEDHSFYQILVGSITGAVLAYMWCGVAQYVCSDKCAINHHIRRHFACDCRLFSHPLLRDSDHALAAHGNESLQDDAARMEDGDNAQNNAPQGGKKSTEANNPEFGTPL